MRKPEPQTSGKNKEEEERISEALDEVSGDRDFTRKLRVPLTERFLLVSFILLIIGLGIVHYLVRLHQLDVPEEYRPLVMRIIRGSLSVILVLLVTRLVSLYFVGRVTEEASRYNLRKILNLVTAVLIALIVLSTVFVNWYGALVSLGLLTLILGVALQNPIQSFFGWVYVLIRRPFRVGDRVKIGLVMGDVVDVGYLDTTLWEFRGDYLSSDHPSGRLVKLPNALIFTNPVFNYSWPLFPYLWNQVTLQVGYKTDFEFLALNMQRIVREELGEEMAGKVRQYKKLLEQTPVDEVEVVEYPVAFFRTGKDARVMARIRYLVEPREAERVKNRLTYSMLKELSRHQDKIQFL